MLNSFMPCRRQIVEETVRCTCICKKSVLYVCPYMLCRCVQEYVCNFSTLFLNHTTVIATDVYKLIMCNLVLEFHMDILEKVLESFGICLA